MSSNTFGGTIKLEGESAYRKAISQISAELKVMGSEMLKVSAEYGKNNTSTQALLKTNENLVSKIDKQKEKIEVLKGALSEASKEYGENDKKTLNWQNSLNKAEAELILMQKELEKNTKILDENSQGLGENTKNVKEFGTESEKTGQKAISLGDIIKANLISDAIKSGISALANGVKEIGSALIDTGKKALESYGDYEQLVGGVETLFGTGGKSLEEYAENVGMSVDEAVGKYDELDTAQGEVIRNANNAYKTSGMSANQYMETVTGFSASLIQSLDGDTLEAAKIADMAIVDMSDNANKMGTSMESIQNAYQGFAKQNYTMLDNLKLGYGGTKSEMERLLKDAEKVSGIKYDISNLSDVYNAIHVIQGELDITGTTAKEASTTIQGSVSAMKSSWQNLLTGIADENADFDGLMDNFASSVSTALKNILPRAEVILQGLVDLVVTIGDTLIPQIGPIASEFINNFTDGITNNLPSLLKGIELTVKELINGISKVIPKLIPLGFDIINTLVNSLLTMLPEILQIGINLLLELVKGISESLPSLIPAIIDSIVLMTTTLLDNIDLIIDAGIELIMGLAQGLIIALPNLIDKIPEIIDKMVQAASDNVPKLMMAGIELVINLGVGLIKAIPNLIAAVPKIMMSIISGVVNYYSQMITKGKELIIKIKDGIMEGISKMPEVGKNLVEGLWNGISDTWTWLKEKIFSFANGITDSIKSFFGIHSPSTLFEDEIGVNLALGVGNGFIEQMNEVKEQMQNVLPRGTDFNTDVKYSGGYDINAFSVSTMEEAFTRALKKLNLSVVIDKDKFGEITTDIVDERFGYGV